MKLTEIKPLPLTEAECSYLLAEGVLGDFEQIVQTNAVKPMHAFKNETVKTFAPKLHAWALAVMNDFTKGAEDVKIPKGLETVKKIINDPVAVAKQILDYVMSDAGKKAKAAVHAADVIDAVKV